MRLRDPILVLGAALGLAIGGHAAAPVEPPDARTRALIDDLLARRSAHLARPGEAGTALAVFMDFDGTIIHGDITEGLAARDGSPGYPGLAETAIRAGLAHGYRGEAGYRAFLARYRALEEEDAGKSYAWLASLFCDLPEPESRDLDALVRRHFETVLRPWLFASSVAVIRELTAAGVEVHVVSASPHPFVLGARHVLPEIPVERLSGIDRRRDPRRRLLDPIVNYAAGKTARVERVIAGRPVKVLGGFGNSWHTDGHFLEAIVRRFDGLSVMINGGKSPKPGHGLLEVTQAALLGP